jgi:hypothetical protein
VKNEPLPWVPEPAPPVDPPCDWCGDRPASVYEVEAAVWSTRQQRNAAGLLVKRRVMTRRAKTGYVCGKHRKHFDELKAKANAKDAA